MTFASLEVRFIGGRVRKTGGNWGQLGMQIAVLVSAVQKQSSDCLASSLTLGTRYGEAKRDAEYGEKRSLCSV